MVQRERRGMIRNGMQRKQAVQHARRQHIERERYSTTMQPAYVKQRKDTAMQHLLLDLYECNSQKLADAGYLHRFLSEVPHLIHMQQVGPVHLDHITDVSDPREAGHSGLVMSASSHVSLHAWPPYRMINIDVFSCE